MAINLQPPPPPPLKNACHNFLYNSLRMPVLKSARVLDWTRLFLVGILIVFFVVALSKAFRKASLSLTKEQVSRSAKSATSSRVSSHLATRMKDWSRVWEGKIGYCELCCWQQNVFGLTKEVLGVKFIRRDGNWCWSLTRPKTSSSKNCLEGRGSMSPFQPLVYIQDLE